MYGQLIGEGMKEPTIVYDRVKKWSNKDLFKKSVIFVPINLSNNHWIIAIIHDPISIINYSKSFQIMICNSVITKETKKKGTKSNKRKEPSYS